ncbi:hypothetical protein [Actinoplanes friuliensis]|jgi:hypothetical protein|uniref:Uncharacterized protein n=1 Tax=Actinoplanes friuliensis DSM 7358 TaxID=1246995 RepID=U5W1L3_9ACTN|nr:hypothetical protein [Actinoplanes friuliensis]AGZ42912.1 hypothetical protein AFR_23210 [Actinoplanes friuliensis DSM 7358]
MSQANSSVTVEQAAQMRGFLEDVEGLARSVSDGVWPRLGQIEGTDATGTVYFSVDDDGAFASVYLDPHWWTALGVSGLPGALLGAQRIARDKLTAARLIFRRVIGPPRRRGPADLGEPGFELMHGLSASRDIGELLGRWHALTAESYQRMYEFDRRQADGSPLRVQGPEELVTFTLDGQVITGVEVDGWRLNAGSTDRLTADIRAALHHNTGGQHG